MSLRNMEVQYVGDTLYLPPLEREVKHIIVKDEDVKDWKHFEPVVRCSDCKHFYEDRRDTSIGWVNVLVCDSKQWSTSSLMPSHTVEPDGFCAWGERREG